MTRDFNRDFALRHGEAGLAVFPCGPDKTPLVAWRDASTTNAQKIAEMWARHPGALPGIDCGKTGIVVLDGDRHANDDGVVEHDGVAALRQLLALHDPGDHAPPIVRTPGDGIHAYFRQNGVRLTNSRGALPAGVDIRGDGGFVVAPFARLPDGRCYEPDPGAPTIFAALANGGLPQVPQGIVELIRAKQTCETNGADNAGGREGKDAFGFPKFFRQVNSRALERIDAWGAGPVPAGRAPERHGRLARRLPRSQAGSRRRSFDPSGWRPRLRRREGPHSN